MQRKGRQFGKMLGRENWQSFGTNKMWEMTEESFKINGEYIDPPM